MSQAKSALKKRQFAVLTESEKNAKQFPSNFICTTKYTLVTFLPLALLNQYRKLTNCYFLMILVLSFIPAITPYSPLLQLLAVVFVLGKIGR